MTTEDLIRAMARTIINRRVNNRDCGAIWGLVSELGLSCPDTEPLLEAMNRKLTSADHEMHREGLAYLK